MVTEISKDEQVEPKQWHLRRWHNNSPICCCCCCASRKRVYATVYTYVMYIYLHIMCSSDIFVHRRLLILLSSVYSLGHDSRSSTGSRLKRTRQTPYSYLCTGTVFVCLIFFTLPFCCLLHHLFDGYFPELLGNSRSLARTPAVVYARRIHPMPAPFS